MSAPIDDGGPAFPMQVKLANGTDNYRGMSLRDWFAGQAVAAVYRNFERDGIDADFASGVAIASYEIADAMLAARKESK